MLKMFSLWTMCAVLVSVHCGNIAMLSGPLYSHFLEASSVGKVLEKHGHHVYMITSDKLEHVARSAWGSDMKALTFKSDWSMEDEQLQLKIYDKMFHGGIVMFDIMDVFNGYSTDMLSDNDLYLQMLDILFDLAYIDSLMHRMYILPYKLGIPYVSHAAFYSPWAAGLPLIPSSYAHPLLQASDNMSLLERFLNVLIQSTEMFLPHLVHPASLITQFAPDKPSTTVQKLIFNSELWMVHLHPLLCPYPTAPNIKFIGGLTIKEAKPLEQNLENIFNSSENGVIVVSFGSIAKFFPRDITEKILLILQGIDKKYTIIWRSLVEKHLTKIEWNSSNIIPLDWLPQNDLLNHPKTKLFITHGGLNGQHEAIYHGVPMVTFPFGGDQTKNGLRAQEQGYGASLSITHDSVETCVKTIHTVLEDPNYRSRVARESKLLRNYPLDAETVVVEWNNHVIQNGGDHLQSISSTMPAYKFLLLDVLALVSIMIFIGCGLSVYFVRFMCQLCKSRTKMPDIKSKQT